MSANSAKYIAQAKRIIRQLGRITPPRSKLATMLRLADLSLSGVFCSDCVPCPKIKLDSIGYVVCGKRILRGSAYYWGRKDVYRILYRAAALERENLSRDTIRPIIHYLRASIPSPAQDVTPYVCPRDIPVERFPSLSVPPVKIRRAVLLPIFGARFAITGGIFRYKLLILPTPPAQKITIKRRAIEARELLFSSFYPSITSPRYIPAPYELDCS
jgi:hypothetical protein